MYDSIKIVLSEKDLNNEISFMEEIPCRIVVSVCSENRVVGYLRNMRVEVRGTTLVVEGSLTKWVLGNNYASNPQLSSSASFLRLNVLSSLN